MAGWGHIVRFGGCYPNANQNESEQQARWLVVAYFGLEEAIRAEPLRISILSFCKLGLSELRPTFSHALSGLFLSELFRAPVTSQPKNLSPSNNHNLRMDNCSQNCLQLGSLPWPVARNLSVQEPLSKYLLSLSQTPPVPGEVKQSNHDLPEGGGTVVEGQRFFQ